MTPTAWQRIEGGLVFAAAMLGVTVFAAMVGAGPWWLLLILFFAPDLGFLGYLGGPRMGAAVYNALHLYGAGLMLAIVGLAVYGVPLWTVAGLLWMGHVGFDRMLGYGLKQVTGFSDTHLGRIGRG